MLRDISRYFIFRHLEKNLDPQINMYVRKSGFYIFNAYFHLWYDFDKFYFGEYEPMRYSFSLRLQGILLLTDDSVSIPSEIFLQSETQRLVHISLSLSDCKRRKSMKQKKKLIK